MAAFKLARELDTDLSMDVAMTADEQLVLMHDDYVDRTTNGQGLVCEKTLDEIKSFDAGSWFGEAYSGERVPMLSEVFAEFGNSTNYHIDLRWPNNCPNMASDRVVEKVVSAINAFYIASHVAFTLDDPNMIRTLKSKLPGSLVLASINVLYTFAPLSSMWSFVDNTGADGVSAHFLMPMLKNVLVEAKKRKKEVFIYTVDSLYVSRWLECLGVDGIITNVPDEVVEKAKCPIYRGTYDDMMVAPLDNANGDGNNRRTITVNEERWIPL